MSAAPQVPVSTDVLKWARAQRGLTTESAAKKLGIKTERLEAIEAGSQNPSLPQLRKMCDVYKRPLIVLLMDEVPTTFQPLMDYRSLSTEDMNKYSPELLDEVNRAMVQRSTYVDLLVEMGQELPSPALPTDRGDATTLAQQIRTLLAVEYKEQRTWRRPEDAFSEWRRRVEATGVMVIETSRVKLKEMRGFSLSEQLPNVIAVNGEDSPRGKTFTLLHELAHLCARHGGVCDLHQFSRSQDDLEIYCNAVAGETLLPLAVVRDFAVVQSHTNGEHWSDAELEQIVSAAGGASTEVVLRRLLQLGLAGRPEYEKRRDEFLLQYEEFRKARRARGGTGGPPPYRMQVRDRGRPFIRSVLNAYSERLITLSDVSELAGVRVKHLQNLQKEAFR